MKKYIFKAPTVINLEITEGCNIRCRHCYNFWREKRQTYLSINKESLSQLIDIFRQAGIFHVVLTGGEPFLNFDLLGYGIKELLKNNISVSCNSNLMLATEQKIKILKDAGLDHILTSLNSYNPDVNDYIVHCKGAFKKILKGIDIAVKSGIRVSVNMIISQWNKTHVYETGMLVHKLGCQKIFGTRVVPPSKANILVGSNFDATGNDYISVLEQLLKVKQDTGIMIGTLVGYPLCMLRDLEKYVDFVGRGCPAQSGHLMSINTNGQTHACVHQAEGYGNIFEIGIYRAYENMRVWHDESYRYGSCKGCCYIDICKTGCRMNSYAHYDAYDKKDNLMKDKNNFLKPYKIIHDPLIYEKIRLGARFYVPGRLRFRKESDFYLVNIRWANSIIVPTKIAEFLMQYQKTGKEFTLFDFGNQEEELLAKLFFKDAIESKDIKYNDFRNMAGLGIDSIFTTKMHD